MHNTDITNRAIKVLDTSASELVNGNLAIYRVSNHDTTNKRYETLRVNGGWKHDLTIEIPVNSGIVNPVAVMLDFVTEVTNGVAMTRAGNQRAISARVTKLDNIFAIAKVKLANGEFVTCEAKIYSERVLNVDRQWATGGFVKPEIANPELPEF